MDTAVFKKGLLVWSWKSRLAARAAAHSMAAGRADRMSFAAVGSGSKEAS